MAKIFNTKGSPFAKLSAEEERDYLNEIFFKQQYYDTLVDLAEASASRFILGQRGIGKSAVILHLFEDMKKLRLLPILIDQYDGFPGRNNKNYFLYSMIVRLTFELAECLMKDKSLKRKLTTTQRQQLGLYIEMFYDPVTARHCVECAESIKSVRLKNKIKTFINNHLSILNNVIGLVVKVGAELIRSYSGLGDVDISASGQQYLSELKLESYKQVPREIIVSWDSGRLKQMLWNLRDMAINLGNVSVVIMFDKIDEISGINGQIEKVTSFMSDFLSDTNLLYSQNIAIVVSLWSEVKNSLNKQGIRFDKFKEIDIRWRDDELIQMLNMRLRYFAINKENAPKFDTLISDKNQATEILTLADKSPRSFFNLLGTILEEERTVGLIREFSMDALTRGKLKYCKKFDYASAQPTRTGKNSDVLYWIARLLQMKSVTFSLNKYAEFYHVQSKTAFLHVQTLLKYNLIKDNIIPSETGETVYKIIDPRINYLITRGEVSLDV